MATPCSVLGVAVTRGFTYDSLGRLTSACNPESNTIQWTYDDSGHPLSRTQFNASQQGVAETDMAYTDPLGRITSKTYNNDGITAPVTYSYNFSGSGGQPPYSFGELTSISTSATFSTSGTLVEPAVTRSILGYDPASGKETGITQQVGSGSTYSVNHVWGPTGLLTQTTMGSTGRSIAYAYDGAGHVTSVTGTLNGVQTPYASNIQYAPHGGVESLLLHNGITESTGYTANLEISSITAQYTPSGQSTQTLFGVSYGYGSGATYGDNGNVVSQTITRGGQTWSQSYGYVEPQFTIGSTTYPTKMWNRLVSVSEPAVSGGTTWSQSFTYDYFGNRALTGFPGFPSSPSNEVPQALTVYGTNNQMTGGSWAYDGAGNTTNFNGLRTASYDAENRIYTATQMGITQQANVTETYAYDGEGRRVAKTGSDGTWTYLYDANGEMAVEYPPTTAPAQVGTRYVTVDALGSTRLVTDTSATPNQLVCEDYLPFGEEIPSGMNGRTAGCFSGADQLPEAQFTGKERDAESGLDYFGARYYAGAQGRFTSPDWSPIQQPVPYANLQDPQTLNLYAYARNNPLSKVDPDGHNWWDKFKNLFGDAACYCEGDEANARAALNRAKTARVDLNKPLSEAQQKQLTEMVTTTVYFGVLGASTDIATSGNAGADANEAIEETALTMINGRLPINSGYAGGTHPTGVPFTKAGFPDFSSYAVAEVQIEGLTGNYAKDAALANQAAGLSATPKGYTWHHVEDAKTMQLVPTDTHKGVGHTGGAAVIRYGGTDK